MGRENKAADALSRKGKPWELFVISTSVATWAKELKASYKGDSEIQEILKQMQAETINSLKYSMHDVLLLYKGKIYLSKECPLKKTMLQ